MCEDSRCYQSARSPVRAPSVPDGGLMREVPTTDELDRMTPEEARCVIARDLCDSIRRWLVRSSMPLPPRRPRKPQKLRSAKEIARSTGLSERSLYRGAARGELRTMRDGRRVLFYPEDVDVFIAERSERRDS